MSTMNWDDVKRIVEGTDNQTLTLYIDVDPTKQENQATVPAWRIWLKNTLRAVEESLSTDQRKWWRDRMVGPIEEFFRTYEPQSRGLAFFATTDNQFDIPMPLPVEPRWRIGNALVAPILWALDEYEPFLIALVDQEKARFFVGQLGSLNFQQQLELDIDDYDFAERTTASNPTPGTVSQGAQGAGTGTPGAVHGGSGRDDFEKMLDEHRARFYREVVGQIGRLAGEQGAQRVIIGGSEPSMHHVMNLMPEKLAASVVDVMPIPMRANTQQIVDLVQPRVQEFERQHEVELVKQVIDFAKAGGRGALGRKDVLDALTMQRVELLIMPWPMEDETLATELPERVYASGGSFELVHGEAAEMLRKEGGIAARLYYAIKETPTA
jgi:hypothetical protein